MRLSELYKNKIQQSYINQEPYVDHGVDLQELASINYLSSLESLLDSWATSVDVHLSDLHDEASSVSLPPSEALEQYQKGMSLLFNDANDFDSSLNHLVQDLRLEMGLSQMTYARNLIYATPKNGGTSAHFDQNINIIYQISGEKKWWLAPNKSVENPLVRHTIGLDVDPEMQSYLNEPMPQTMPSEGLQEITLKPGSVLFLPRGYWHKTQALTDALALNFTFSAPSWVDLFTAALRARLVQSPEWRETADHVTDPKLCHKAIDRFDELLAELAHEAPMWRAHNILSMTESH